jgi:DNA-binding response OmpR family regulator
MESRYQKVLIVEDDATLRSLISRNLSARGHTVVEEETAAGALKALQAESPDLMLLDINLPDQSGWNVLRQVDGLNIPTVIISAVRVSQARLDEFRPLAYLPKPFPLEALLRIVEDVQAHEVKRRGA